MIQNELDAELATKLANLRTERSRLILEATAERDRRIQQEVLPKEEMIARLTKEATELHKELRNEGADIHSLFGKKDQTEVYRVRVQIYSEKKKRLNLTYVKKQSEQNFCKWKRAEIKHEMQSKIININMDFDCKQAQARRDYLNAVGELIMTKKND